MSMMPSWVPSIFSNTFYRDAPENVSRLNADDEQARDREYGQASGLAGGQRRDPTAPSSHCAEDNCELFNKMHVEEEPADIQMSEAENAVVIGSPEHSDPLSATISRRSSEPLHSGFEVASPNLGEPLGKIVSGIQKLVFDQEKATGCRVRLVEPRRKWKRYLEEFHECRIAFVQACPSGDIVELQLLSEKLNKSSTKLEKTAMELEAVDADLTALEFQITVQFERLQSRWKKIDPSWNTDAETESFSSRSSSPAEVLYHGPEYIIPPNDVPDLDLNAIA